ncbi:MAG: hypothetical protein LBR00_00610, partial [Clostridiales Family XIII bacterium]|nr:hypothetical protein [Clostridiales Family XIII bacterium]
MKTKRIFALALASALALACAFPLTAAAAKAKEKTGVSPQAYTNWYETDGPNGPYTLTTGEDLKTLSDIVSGKYAGNGNVADDFAGETILLGNSLNLSGVGAITPIGTQAHPFAGTFDGNGKTLSGLALAVPASKQYIGLFGYASAASVIRNLDITMTLNVSATTQIRYVGAVAAFTQGKIDNCDVTADITLTSTMKADKNKPGMLRAIGGIAGQACGDLSNCVFDGEINLSCASDVTDRMGNVAGEVGGIVGIFGDPSSSVAAAPPTLSGCTNSADLNFDISGAGGKDRFGADLYAHSQSVGGIAGYSMGNIRGCVNTGTVYTGVKSGSNMVTTSVTIKKPVAGFGASATGGIVGSLRGTSFDDLSDSDTATVGNPPYNYFKSKGGKTAGAAAQPETVEVTDCVNKGVVIGLSGVGGIVGSSTGWSLIEGCTNSGDIMGCRWTKPFSGGIGGTSYSDILYCCNRGNIYSIAGAGYYCAGISGSLGSDNTTATETNDRVSEPLLTGCYTTGNIYMEDAGYRTGILVGENTGFLQYNAFIPKLTLDNKIVDTNSGTVSDTVETSQFSVADMMSSKSIARLNTYAAGKGAWEMLYVKDAAGTNDGYPVLVRAGGDPDKMSLSPAAVLSGTPVLADDAKYSRALDPVPKVTMAGLYQNADFFVEPQSGTAGANASTTATYTGTVKGMGAYKGSVGTVTYRILQAPIAECTIQAEPVVYNWRVQRPTADKVNLYDASGNLVASGQYTVSDEYDPSKG